MMRYEDIPRFISPPRYCTHQPWASLEEYLKDLDDRSVPGWLGLQLDPPFQRAHVWTEDKQVAFVEYCLRDGEYSRTLLFNHPNWQGSYQGEMVLVDGKQRLEAVRKFLRNELAIFGGNFLKDFDDQRRLLRSNGAHFNVAVNNLKTKREIMIWYLQLNKGGVVHSKEELDKVEEMLKKEKS